MMTLKKLVEYLSAEPFRPFQINMASGSVIEIRHPENIAVSRTSAKIYAPEVDSGENERWHDVSMMHMELIAPIESPANPNQE